ncbi:hypothetical protein DPEC_G00135730 [Dallia pectoralis]|uniref:Uncharacterized protein n=1 Tax=Dallia pectoralis TaxID=75939 RepID=A0ACC2GLM9_DALPE|nr:hypothetical protein DPEC_G00135730 [Dallia pectoralis]
MTDLLPPMGFIPVMMKMKLMRRAPSQRPVRRARHQWRAPPGPIDHSWQSHSTTSTPRSPSPPRAWIWWQMNPIWEPLQASQSLPPPWTSVQPWV